MKIVAFEEIKCYNLSWTNKLNRDDMFPRGIKREFGANPKRTRHCDRERLYIMSLEKSEKAYRSEDLKSGYLLVVF